jgi:hypothetical protein
LSAPLLALLLGAAVAAGLVACGEGGDDLLPGETASEINANLDSVEQLVAEGDCIGAEDAAAAVTGQVESLSGIDAKLKRALSEGATRLNEVIAECDEAVSEEPVETIAPEEELEEEGEEKEKPEKPGKEKQEEKVPEETEEDGEGPTLPPQSNGKGEENGKSNGPPVEPEAPSGGVGPGAAVEEG